MAEGSSGAVWFGAPGFEVLDVSDAGSELVVEVQTTATTVVNHNGRYASDRSRDRLILNSGVQTHRIPIEETRDRSDLVEVLRHPIWQVCKIDVRRLDLWWDNAPGRGAA